ncbi:MAG TPA: phosphatase PAP2 family protein [Pseudomonadales bacterium]|nr:phosphatase PAP2 family protein [Pseudomonadales bacterium]
MKQFFWTLPLNIIGCFKGRMIIWHIIAIILTVILVVSGFDWAYFCFTRKPDLLACMWPAAVIGQLIPLTVPLYLLLIGSVTEKPGMTRTGWATGQAALIGWFLASFYKAFTGRYHLPHDISTDTSHIFRFGFMRGGIFWGWPSSHTATAFAMAVTIFTLFPKQKWLRVGVILYATYIGIGVSMTIHWFSDFVAGAILGSVIGVTIGKSFSKENLPAKI